MRVFAQISTKQTIGGLAAGVLLALAACDTPTAPTLTPRPRPVELAAPPPVAPKPYVRSAASSNLTKLFAREQARLLTLGLMRIDGGGPDTPFTSTILARNFEQIALFSEHSIGSGNITTSNTPNLLRRWKTPVRYGVEFGASVPENQRQSDRATVSRYVGRLARITNHPISITTSNPNFLVLVAGEDDRSATLARIKKFVPGIDPAWLARLGRLPRTTHCIVLAFEGAASNFEYIKSVALIRAEDPPEMRRSCVHEELAQGLGLLNDSPAARPSIFNDDEEFALLTNHDEMLLKILYDPRISPGMTAAQTRPIVRVIAKELADG